MKTFIKYMHYLQYIINRHFIKKEIQMANNLRVKSSEFPSLKEMKNKTTRYFSSIKYVCMYLVSCEMVLICQHEPKNCEPDQPLTHCKVFILG